MKILTAFLLLVFCGCAERASSPPADWQAWVRWVEDKKPVGDADGHGPDIGSNEWSAALSRELGITDAEGHGPDVGSAEWRATVESKLPD